jgi:hypothetical protein
MGLVVGFGDHKNSGKLGEFQGTLRYVTVWLYSTPMTLTNR